MALELALLAYCFLAALYRPDHNNNPVPQQPAYNGPVVEIGGAEPRYEPYNPNNLQDYKR
jgi:rare lipoprotein A